jgi:hypothetical protein
VQECNRKEVNRLAERYRPVEDYPPEVQYYLSLGFILEELPTVITWLDRRINADAWRGAHMHTGRKSWHEEVRATRAFYTAPTKGRTHFIQANVNEEEKPEYEDLLGDTPHGHTRGALLQGPNDLGLALAKLDPQIRRDLQSIMNIGVPEEQTYSTPGSRAQHESYERRKRAKAARRGRDGPDDSDLDR